MGYLAKGVWHDGRPDSTNTGGEFIRPDVQFRDRITADGSSGYPAEAGRYHLYVSLACPWAHRTIVFRRLKRLEEVISMSIVEPVMWKAGWAFSAALPDHVNGFDCLHQVYTKANPEYSGRVSVPVLWDKERATIVNNESSELIRMLNSEFAQHVPAGDDYYPPRLRHDIDELNAVVYANVNNGVYRCGFAGTQQAYEGAVRRLFETLDMLEARLSQARYLTGDTLTEADWRLFTTLVRFDAVYHGHFKCNLRRIEDYPNLAPYLRDLYQVPGVSDTVSFDHIKRHYYMSHEDINPRRIVPLGPILDLERPHGREKVGP
jgi:glutathionyl-hydroquinone reductase